MPKTIDQYVEELKRTLKRVRVKDEGEYWVAESDHLLDEDGLREYAQERKNEDDGRAAAAGGSGTSQLVGIKQGGQTVKWPDAQKTALTYCILKKSFETEKLDANGDVTESVMDADAEARYAKAKQLLAEAAGAWEKACGVKFVYKPQFDSRPTTKVPEVVFAVRMVDTEGAILASSFYPNTRQDNRRMLVDKGLFEGAWGFDPAGVVRHELGHVLGFKHEPVRSGARPTCPDERQVKEDDAAGEAFDITEYDPQSVMHFYCKNLPFSDEQKQMQLSDLDRAGARQLYGPPA